jgi:hypothetical protein
MPDAGAGRRLPAALRAAPGARPGRPGLDRRDGRAGGVHGGALPRPRQADAGARRDPADRRRVRARVRPRLGRPGAPYRCEDAETIVVAWARCSGTIKDVVDEMREAGEPDRRARHLLVPAVPAGGGARGAERRETGRGAGEEPRRRLGGIVATNVRMALSGIQLQGYTVIAGLGRAADHQASLHACSTRRGRDALEPVTFLDLDHDVVNRELERERARRAARADRREHPARRRRRRRGMGDERSDAMTDRNRQVLPDRHLHRRQPAARPRESARCRPWRTNSLNSGHRACQGCGEALGARYAIDAAMRATDNQLIAANATGCLEVFSTPYPETSWQIPWIHSLFGNAAAVATGMAAAMKVKGRAQATSASSPRAATAAPPTSASAACRGCSSATTTCSTSATTTRPT